MATLGLGHTLDCGLSINLEASHDAGGYSRLEWDQLAEALDAITPVQSDIQGQALSQLNGVLNHYTLRKNYTLLRLFNERLLDSSISGELTLLYGIDDGSGSMGLRFEALLGDRTTTGLYVTPRFGNENDEFMLRPESDSISLYMTAKF